MMPGKCACPSSMRRTRFLRISCFTVTGLYPALRSSLIVLGFCSTTVAPSFVGLRQETRNLVSGEVRKATPLVLALHYNHNLSPRRHGWLTFPDERTDAAARHSGALDRVQRALAVLLRDRNEQCTGREQPEWVERGGTADRPRQR